MIAALLAAAAAALAVGPSPDRRARKLWVSPSGSGQRTMPPANWWAAAMCPLAGFIFIGWPWGLVVGAAAAPVVQDLVRRAESSADQKRSAELRRQLPGALDLIAAALSAGRPPASALSIVGRAIPPPLSSELGLIASRLEASGDLRSALVEIPDALTVLARAFTRAEDSGAPIADVVAASANDVRRQAAAERREAARRVGVRTAAPLGLCFLPAFFLVGIVPTVIAIGTTSIPW